MRPLFLFVCLVLAVAPAGVAQKKEIQELQRDVGLLAQDVKDSLKRHEDKIEQLQTLVQQALQAAIKANEAASKLSATMNKALDDQEKNLRTPLAGVGTKVDSMAEQFSGLREDVRAMAAGISRLDTKLTDINSAIRAIQTPAAPPPTTPGPGNSAPTAVQPPPGVSAESTYQNAQRDYQNGRYDLALEGYSDFLKYFDKSDLAPNAQFWIGSILRQKKDYEGALKAFDLVLEKYPENLKSADARLSKAQVLVLLGRRTDAVQEFKEITERYKGTEQAARANDELRKLGMAGSTTRNKKK
jgi:tol-pal system protein YbgF